MPHLTPPLNAFPLTVAVQPGDIDDLQHVNNMVYLRWVQEVAGAHWGAVAPTEAQTGLVWVVMRHEIDYKVAAKLGDEVLLQTWVGTAVGVTFERHTRISRAADGVVLAQARTLWCPINAQTGRPQRVTAELRALFSVPE
ncbi:MAG: acyl-CoA thioesterase [Hymenobacteraceae bacterium]|nr:acyl-CoA thioesterase [Hymenobacteraceae bacterium]